MRSVRDYAKGAALIFGAYKGLARPGYEFFDGALDEWRFWNGARSDRYSVYLLYLLYLLCLRTRTEVQILRPGALLERRAPR
jgi:hypothetical protein